jgi:hypothetical protein
MGCWNKTCGLSNLFINSGTPVYVFVLERNKKVDSLCYSTPFYSPLLLPFESEYNDYGGGENSSGPAMTLIMEAIKEQLVEVEVGDNQYHDIAVKKADFDEELFFEAIHEDRLKVQQHSMAEPTDVGFVMFRKDVVDDIIANWKREEYVGDGKGTTGWDNNYIIYGFKDIVADLPEFLDKLEENLSEDEDGGLNMRFFGGIKDLFKYGDPNKVGKWMRGDHYRYSKILDISDVIVSLMQEGKRKDAQLLLIEHLKAKYIDGFMHSTRRVWIPGGHEGSQDQEHHGYRIMNAAIAKVLDAKKAEFELENDEEFSEF